MSPPALSTHGRLFAVGTISYFGEVGFNPLNYVSLPSGKKAVWPVSLP